MKYIRLFSSETAYNAVKDSMPKPHVCYIQDTDEVIYQEVDTITFADATAKSLMVAAYDLNGDGEISFEEALAATSLSVAFKNNRVITDMSFLKYFKNIVFPTNSSELFSGMTSCVKFDISGCNFSSATNLSALFRSCHSATEIACRNCDFSNATRFGTFFETSSTQSMVVDFRGATLPSYSNLSVHGSFFGSQSLITFLMDNCSQDSVNTLKLLCQEVANVANARIVFNGETLKYDNGEWVTDTEE